VSDKLKLKDNYVLARCCAPSPADDIVGYNSHDNYLKVHRRDCSALDKTDAARLVPLSWSDILAEKDFTPGDDYRQLDAVDFAILKHHSDYGIDYSLMIAGMLNLPRQQAFDRHKKLKTLGLLQRVEPTMVQYRRGITDHKWIKHRNHSYYELTKKGKQYLGYFDKKGDD
jgi:hypothetical protein